jgi:hypothetical protein
MEGKIGLRDCAARMGFANHASVYSLIVAITRNVTIKKEVDFRSIINKY